MACDAMLVLSPRTMMMVWYASGIIEKKTPRNAHDDV